jgi:hypothetical protein
VTWEMKCSCFFGGSATASAFSESTGEVHSQVAGSSYVSFSTELRVVAGDIIAIRMVAPAGGIAFLRNARISFDLVEAGDGVALN